MALYITNHPLIQHKLTIMRKRETGTLEFRELLKEIGMLMGYEVCRDFPLKEVEIETPMQKMTAHELDGKKVAVVPILRAGLGMVDGLLTLIPAAKVGHIGMYRDEKTHEPVFYYYKMPEGKDRMVILTDPMLATGGSLELAYQALCTKGIPKQLHLCCVIAAQDGIDNLMKLFKPLDNVTLWCAAIDPILNEHKYIVPGLGDAGDLAYGDKI